MTTYHKKKFYKKSNKNDIKNDEVLSSNYKWLIIVESPSKCIKIEHFLGSEYKCIASKGHLREICGLKSINTKTNYEPQFSIIKKQEKQIEYMRKIIQNFSHEKILLASDDDREGEAIAWHICELFNLPTDSTPRIVFHEVTQPALKSAVDNPRFVDMNLVKAQHARQILDILIGYKISPTLWRYMYNNKDNALSAGRCQSPALRLIYDNHIEKTNIEYENTYKIIGNFFDKKIDFTLNHEFKNDKEVLNFLNDSIQHKYELSISSPKNSFTSPPKPFNTSALLQSANNILSLSPKDTMKLCQILYQDGYITYMRTDNRKYSTKFIEEIKPFIKSQYGDIYIGDFDKIENKDKNNPHEAIRVTKIDIIDLESKGYEKGKLVSLYKLIWKNTLQSCMAEYKYESHDITISSLNDYYYKYIIDRPIFYGWKQCQNNINLLDEQNTKSSLLMYFTLFIQNKKKNHTK